MAKTETSRLYKKSKKVGMPPGTLVHVGEKKVKEVTISMMDYDEKDLREKQVKNIEECLEFKNASTVTWINVIGLHDLGIIEKIGKHFDIHPLILEDILSTGQRPKFEDFDNYLFIVLKMLYYDEKKGEVNSEQISIVVSPTFVISFQESDNKLFEPIISRIRSARGRVRKSGTDYLAYALMDVIVDNYSVVLEKIGERIEALEDELTKNPRSDIVQSIHDLKGEVIFLRKSVWPLKEMISKMQKGDSELIKEKTLVFLGDVYDHTVEAIETVDSFRETLSGLLDFYLSLSGNKMNEVMKVLTIIATIFIPLTFIVGIYGMNFPSMPELELSWGYPAILVIMLIIVFIMLIYFRKKNWI